MSEEPTPPAPLPKGKGEKASCPSPLAGEGGGASPPGEGWRLGWAIVSPLTRLEDSPPSPARGEGKDNSPPPFREGGWGGGFFVNDPKTAMLFASVAPLVKVTSSGAAPSRPATRSRASSSARRAARPTACADDGLPKVSSISGRIAPHTPGSSGVVALWSR